MSGDQDEINLDEEDQQLQDEEKESGTNPDEIEVIVDETTDHGPIGPPILPTPQQEQQECLETLPSAATADNTNPETSVSGACARRVGDDNLPGATSSNTMGQDWKLRIRQLKQKMNQAKQLNKQAVIVEGERSTTGRSSSVVKDTSQHHVPTVGQKGGVKPSTPGSDNSYLTEQAVDTMRKARIAADKAESSAFSFDDYYNPEGQHRHYQRDLKSIPKSSSSSSNNNTSSIAASIITTATYNPLLAVGAVDPDMERNGARRIADEMRRRIEKNTKRQLKRKDRNDTDVSYINERNKKYNEKISRTYDKHTKEIRDNLERGTAL